MNELSFINPDWPAPATVRAVSTTREGGVSVDGFQSLNLAAHVGDEASAVAENRRRLVERLALPAEPFWLEQVHGCDLLSAGESPKGPADGSYSAASGVVCAVMTADCLPVLFCDRHGRWVAAAHAGWRGLLNGILERSVAAWSGQPSELLAWLGPAIGPQRFEVGEEVRAAFLTADPGAGSAFRANRQGHWLADLYQLARRRLRRAGVDHVYGGEYCTYSDAARFFSYRRDGVTGRFASLIWMES